MEVVGPENEIQMGKPLEQPLPLLLSKTAANSDNHFPFFLFQISQPSKGTVHLVLGLLPNRAGIKQNHVSLMNVLSGLIVLCIQDLKDLL